MTAYYCHPTAVVDEGAQVGEGSNIWHFTHLMSGAQLGADVVCGQNVYVGGRVRVGSGCRIQNNVSLYDGVILEADVFVGPSVVFTNVRRPRAAFPRKDAFETTLVKSGASIGANATIVCGTTLGVASFVAAGAVVTRDVPDFALVAGAPARQIGWVCRCGERLGDEPESRCAACQRRYRSGPEGLIELAHD